MALDSRLRRKERKVCTTQGNTLSSIERYLMNALL
jgi:hypothetical protein